MLVYINGQMQPLIRAPFGLVQDNTDVTIGGRSSPNSSSVDGMMDEVRLSRVVRSPAWILGSYLSQAETVLGFGLAESAP